MSDPHETLVTAQADGDDRIPCPECGGRGFTLHRTMYSATRIGCRRCEGSGKVSRGGTGHTEGSSTAKRGSF